MPVYKTPKSIIAPSGCCGGCGHGIIQRLIAESLEELGLQAQVIACVVIACSESVSYTHLDVYKRQG